jgi:hypothetical protein
MKRIAFTLAFLPGAALAHGGHEHVPEAAHGLAHLGAPLALAVAAVAIAWWLGRDRDEG